jgi:hypothetical protein
MVLETEHKRIQQAKVDRAITGDWFDLFCIHPA